MAWKPGDRLTHRFNPDLGPGVVSGVEDRTVIVEFPTTGATLRLAATSDAITPLELRPGSPARLLSSGDHVTFEGLTSTGQARLGDGRIVEERDVWPVEIGESLFERLALGDIGSPEEFALRLDALHLAGVREADGLGSFLGGRIHLFPHQLYTAERATAADPVRWLLADEVGLGKTVEASLVLNHLLRTGRGDRTLVVAPDTLTVQWLGELWRKYHQVVGDASGQPVPDGASRGSGDRSVDRRRSPSPAPATRASWRYRLPRGGADRGARPSRVVAHGYAVGGRRPRLFPSAAAPATGGAS
jgi:ATP-dependent helicase HepA